MTAKLAKSSGRGSKPGERRGGRQKGTPNQKTAEQIEAVKATGMTPLEYMLKLMRDNNEAKDVRLEAAKAAAPYVHPRLASTDMKVSGGLTHEDALASLR